MKNDQGDITITHWKAGRFPIPAGSERFPAGRYVSISMYRTQDYFGCRPALDRTLWFGQIYLPPLHMIIFKPTRTQILDTLEVSLAQTHM